jgi:hypothetical protein
MPHHGPLSRISSALNSELNASARTVVAVALGPDRGDRLGVGETVGVQAGCELPAPDSTRWRVAFVGTSSPRSWYPLFWVVGTAS